MLLCAVALVLPAPASAQATAVATPPVPTLAPMLARVTPGVVGISVVQQRQQDNPLANDPAFRRFFEEREGPRRQAPGPGQGGSAAAPEAQAAGSGVVIDAEEGLVLTNHHVVQGATRLVVVLKDRREFEARLVGSDAGTDVALLKINATNLTAVPLGDSDRVQVGDYVVAIGNPFGIGQTVTAGIVSALGRGLSPEGYEDYIQTDAPINPGNSGGALVSLRGELVGMPTAILGAGRGGQPGNIGIGFAVPTTMARAVIAQLQRFGEVRRGRVGLQSRDLTPRLAAERRLAVQEGALVDVVERNSPAERGGVRVGDVIVQAAGRAVRGASDLRNQLALIPVGEQVRLQYVRGSATAAELTVTVAAITGSSPQQPATPAAPGSEREPRPGPTPAPGPGQGPAQPGEGFLNGVQLSEGREGLSVSRVDPRSRAHAAGLRDGDVILGVNRQPVSSAAALNATLRAPGEHVLSVLRGESKFRLVLRN